MERDSVRPRGMSLDGGEVVSLEGLRGVIRNEKVHIDLDGPLNGG